MSEFEIVPQSLPPSWTVTTLGAVLDYGKTEKAESSEIPGNAERRLFNAPAATPPA